MTRLRLAIALAALLLGSAAATERNGPTLFEGADPAALVEGGRVWLYPTGPGDRLYAWGSTDLARWRRRGQLIALKDIGWIGRGEGRMLWAPHMAAANGRYYLYYSVGPQGERPSKIGVAVCARPAGPCTDSGRALIDGSDADDVLVRPSGTCTDGMPPTGDGRYKFEAIDPMVFVDPATGRRLLYAGGSNGSTLRAFELAPDMVTIAREVPIAQPPCFTEGAWMHLRGGVYYLSYSSGHWDRSDYSVRYVTGPTPTGPWTYRGTILKSAGLYKGPGHHAFLQDPRSGQWLAAYHRWEGVTGEGPYRDAQRRVAIAAVRYAADGSIEPIAPDEPADRR